jgi:phosphate transport system permease protein
MTLETVTTHTPLFTATPATRRKLRSERTAAFIFGSMAGLILLPLVVLMVYIVLKAAPVLSWSFVFDVPRDGMRTGGVWSPLIGTVNLVVLSLLASAPVGILAGIYLNEYARDNGFTRMIHLAVVNLAGVPSIVHALFGVGAFVIFAGMGKSILAASLTIAIMTLPVIIVATREAMAAVPQSYRLACWNLGASKWEAIRTIVLPNSIGGILTGIILAVCRAAGETAPIMFTGAVFFKFVERGDPFPYALNEQCMALSYHLHTLATQVPGVPEAALYGTAVVLLAFVLAFNSVAILIRSWLRNRKRW